MEQRVPASSWPTRGAARTCSCSGCSATSTASTSSSRRDQIALTFGKKDEKVITTNVALWKPAAPGRTPTSTSSTASRATRSNEPQIVINGNTAIGLGVLASGMDICAMYPITPATSASHYLSDVFERVGGLVHQAEDEIAACAFAIGASYAGKCAVTITSGPGYSLKQEAIGLAVMAEIPLVVVNVQRGGPSTGQPTKVEQGDLLTAMFGSHGDAPKVVMAASSIEDCFYSMITARKIAETFNMVVVVLSDASLATAQQPVPPAAVQRRLAGAAGGPDARCSRAPSPTTGIRSTGLARRFIPGQPGGMHTLTGLAHDRESHVAYDPAINEEGLRHRSLKLAALQKTLKTPPVYGDPKGDLLIVGWGSTKGVIEEAVDRLRAEGLKVSSLHLRFIQPLASGMKDILKGFKQVMTVEGNWSDRLEDQLIDEDNRRYSALAMMLRKRSWWPLLLTAAAAAYFAVAVWVTTRTTAATRAPSIALATADLRAGRRRSGEDRASPIPARPWPISPRPATSTTGASSCGLSASRPLQPAHRAYRRPASCFLTPSRRRPSSAASSSTTRRWRSPSSLLPRSSA